MRLAVVDLSPLRRREFRLLFCGQLVSTAGSMLTFVAIPFQVFALTESSLAVGLLGVAEIGPILVFALLSGALADAVDRRRLVMLAEAGAAVVAAALLINALAPEPQVWVLFVCASLAAACNALLRPPANAMLARLVPREELKPAMALEWLRRDVGQLAGPALGGVLIAAAGVAATYAIDLLTFLASLALLAAMQRMPPPEVAERPSLGGIAAGLRYARSRQEILGTYLVDMNAMFFAVPLALFPALAVGYGGAEALGVLYAAPALGSILVAATSGWTRRVHRHGRAIVLAACGWGAGIVAFGLAQSLWLAVVCLAVAGAMDAVSGLFRGVLWNETVPDHLRGRLSGIEMISWSSGPTLGTRGRAPSPPPSENAPPCSPGASCASRARSRSPPRCPGSGATTPARPRGRWVDRPSLRRRPRACSGRGRSTPRDRAAPSRRR